MLHFLFFFGIFSYLHGLIRTYTFTYLFLGKVATYMVFYFINIKKFPPTRLLISEKTSHLYCYLGPTLIVKSRVQNKSRNIQVLLHFVYSAIFYRHFLIHFAVSASLVKIERLNYNLHLAESHSYDFFSNLYCDFLS